MLLIIYVLFYCRNFYNVGWITVWILLPVGVRLLIAGFFTLFKKQNNVYCQDCKYKCVLNQKSIAPKMKKLSLKTSRVFFCPTNYSIFRLAA